MVVKTDGQYQIRWKYSNINGIISRLNGRKVEVASDAWIRVDAARKVVDNILASGKLFMASIQALVHWLAHRFLTRI